MSPQLVLIIIGAVNVLMGIAIYVGAESIVTGGAFSSYLLNDASIKVGVYMHEAVASFMIAFGFVALLSRYLENGPAKKLLFAIGVAYVVNLTSVLLHTMNPESSESRNISQMHCSTRRISRRFAMITVV